MFWTWDTTEIMAQKFDNIVKPLQLGGVMAWSLVEDSYDWSHVLALQAGMKGLNGTVSSGSGNTTSTTTATTTTTGTITATGSVAATGPPVVTPFTTSAAAGKVRRMGRKEGS
jgi:GH18 family chitinase